LRFIALLSSACRSLLAGFFPGFELLVGAVSVCTSVLVLVPIVISKGMVAVCHLSGSFIESGDVARSSLIVGFSMSSLVGGSHAIASSISVRLAPR
jgi:hypothetical protein